MYFLLFGRFLIIAEIGGTGVLNDWDIKSMCHHYLELGHL